MTILYALLVRHVYFLVTKLATTITSLYDLTYYIAIPTVYVSTELTHLAVRCFYVVGQVL